MMVTKAIATTSTSTKASTTFMGSAKDHLGLAPRPSVRPTRWPGAPDEPPYNLIDPAHSGVGGTVRWQAEQPDAIPPSRTTPFGQSWGGPTQIGEQMPWRGRDESDGDNCDDTIDDTGG